MLSFPLTADGPILPPCLLPTTHPRPCAPRVPQAEELQRRLQAALGEGQAAAGEAAALQQILDVKSDRLAGGCCET